MNMAWLDARPAVDGISAVVNRGFSHKYPVANGSQDHGTVLLMDPRHFAAQEGSFRSRGNRSPEGTHKSFSALDSFDDVMPWRRNNVIMER